MKRFVKTCGGSLLPVLLFSSSAHAMGSKPPGANALQAHAAQVLTAFQSGCTSIGSWTGAAESQTQVFLALIDSMKQTDACKPYQAQLSAIQSLGTQIQAVSSNADYLAYRQTQEQVQQLTLELQGATDPDQIAALKTALVTAQVNLALDRGNSLGSSQVSGRDRFWSQSGQLAQYMGSLLTSVDPNSSPTLAECLKENPEAAVGMATNLLAFGGSFISPVYGAGTAVIGQLVNLGVEVYHEIPYDQAKDAINEAQLPLSLSCGLESMSELYCGADDSFSLISLAANSYDDTAHPNPIWKGLDLLGRRFPVLTSWLSEVKNGVPPTDPTQAGEQAMVEQQLFNVESTNLSVVGTLNQAISLYNASNGTSPSYIQSAVANTATSLGLLDGQNMNQPTPFSSFQPNPYLWACWLVLGWVPPDSAGICNIPSNQGQLTQSQVQNYVQGTLLKTISGDVVNGLLKNWSEVESKVYDYVMVQFSQTITTNPDTLLAAVKEQSNNISPYAVLTETKELIEGMLANLDPANPRLGSTLREKKRMIEKAQWYIDAADNDIRDWGDGAGPIKLCPDHKDTKGSMTPAQCEQYRLAQIFELFDLKDGVEVFSTDISHFVTWDLQRRLQSGDLPPDVSEILRTAGIDISLRLEAAGLSDLAAVQNDLNNSRKLSRANLSSFRSFFGKAFSTTVQELAKASQDEPTDGPNRPNGELLGRLCTLWLATSQDGKDFPDAQSAQICSSSKLYSIYARKDASGHYIPTLDVGKLTRELQGKPFMDRVCAYHRYLRQEQLSEIIPNGASLNAPIISR